jgi:hypothetical protein
MLIGSISGMQQQQLLWQQLEVALPTQMQAAVAAAGAG